MINPNSPDYQNTPVSSRRPKFHYRLVNASVEPIVSIITPFYNTNGVFHETAQSVLGQSLQQWEWLIINDGSDDPQSLEILRKYRNLDLRIRIIDHDKNLGPSAARNTGVRYARSEYILPLDSDDLIEPTMIEKYYWLLETHPEWSFAGCYSVGFDAHTYLWQNGFQSNEKNLNENLIDHTSLIRKSVYIEVNGYDETMREGLEDWDFWIRSAAQGFWGYTIPEFLKWYRTRESHTSKWSDWTEKRIEDYKKLITKRFPHLSKKGFPKIQSKWRLPYELISFDIPCDNRLQKVLPRLLLLVPWLSIGGADKFNLDLLSHLKKKQWDITIATTLPSDNLWLHEFSKFTPDIFVLNNFLALSDFPRFLKYLVLSRNVDCILISNSMLSYKLIPYLRAEFPEISIVDFNHAIAYNWNNGGYPHQSTLYQQYLDMHIVASQQVKDWMIVDGTAADHIHVCHLGIDRDFWKPNLAKRNLIRTDARIDNEIPLILYIARLVEEKQPAVFAKTMLLLTKEKLAFRAVVIGDGPLLKWINEFVILHKLENTITILGAQPTEIVRDWIQAGDIVFLPTQSEGISLSLYEGMACGLTVVSADVGGQRELVTPQCGILLLPSDEENEVVQYAHELAHLIQNPEVMRQMGNAAYERIEKYFPIEKMGNRMLTLLNHAISLQEKRPGAFVPKTVGQTIAQEAIENIYLSSLADELWQQRINYHQVPLRVQLYLRIRNLLYPIYLGLNGPRIRWMDIVIKLMKQGLKL